MATENSAQPETQEVQNMASETVGTDVNVSNESAPTEKSPTMQGSQPAEKQEDDEEIYEPFGDWVEGIEDIQQYKEGGHHPVHLNDVLNDRYQVLHKLGSGGFGNVWLCYDTADNKWRAVKVLTARHGGLGREQLIYDRLKSKASVESLLEDSHLALPLAEFWIDGPNGRHLCLVLPVLGKSLVQWGWGVSPIDDGTAQKREFCRQLAKAVGFLHGAGICHGDLKPLNTLIRLDKVEDMGKDELLALIGEPEIWDLDTVSGEPAAPHGPDYIVSPATSSWCNNLLTNSLAIIDFGESFFADEPPEEERATSYPYAPPEVLFPKTHMHGYGSDTWALAATFFEVRTQDCLFGGEFVRDTAGEIELVLGPLPEPYKTKWIEELNDPKKRHLRRPYRVGAAVEPERQRRIEGSGYSDVLEAKLGEERRYCPEAALGESDESGVITYRYPREEVLQLADLLRRMLHYDPAKRLPTDQVIRHPWFGQEKESRVLVWLKKRVSLFFLVLAVSIAQAAYLFYLFSGPWHRHEVPIIGRSLSNMTHKSTQCCHCDLQ